MQLSFETSDEIRSHINSIGRTEDVKFSPDKNRFIIVEFLANKLHLFKVKFDQKVASPRISITNYCRYTSKDIKNPHGVCFLGNDRIVVCNRSGDVSIFKIPDSGDQVNEVEIKAEKSISGKGYLAAKVKTPGSVAVDQLSENTFRIFVCNNHWHMITSHKIELDDTLGIINEGIRIQDSLKIPDGISISPDGKWIAVSNHVDGQAVVYRNSSTLDSETAPYAILNGPVCPHGIRFSPDGKKLYVADAASPYLYIFENENGEWNNSQTSVRSVRILEDEDFYSGRYGAREGGLKGIDIDASNSLLITTCKNKVISFYDVNVLNEKNDKIEENVIANLRDQRDQSFSNNRLLNRRWTLRNRISAAIKTNKYLQPANYKMKLSNDLNIWRLRLMNLISDKSLIDPSGPIVSLTSHGDRIETVFYTIESIRQGSLKPSRIILWLDDEDKKIQLPKELLRLQEAGLEIYYSENIGPHKKYYTFIQQNDDFTKPLVTADDDILYPAYWLKELVKAYKSTPSVIHCFRAHSMSIENGKFVPYNDWRKCESDKPSHKNFITGVSGVIYPPDFLQFLKKMGEGFLTTCPKNDDIWLSVTAFRTGFKIAQIESEPKFFTVIPGSQKESLYQKNVIQGGNHKQLVDTFTDEDIQKLEILLMEEKKKIERKVFA